MEGSVRIEKAPAIFSSLQHVGRGDLLGVLDRRTAEKAFRYYQEHRIDSLYWEGDALVGTMGSTRLTAHIIDAEKVHELACHCSQCGIRRSLCPHAAAAVLRWLDVRSTLIRMGVGSSWRAHSRHPFVPPRSGPEDRVDLSHLTGVDLRSALELQLSLQKTGKARVRLVGQEVQTTISLPSGDSRCAVFSASLLASALPILRSMPRIRMEGELENLELSELRLRPVLLASWKDDGLLLEPGYRLGNRSVLLSSELEGRIHGRWARVGTHLCLVHDPPTPLLPFQRKGRTLLSGREALSFLKLDHPQLKKHSWYLPQGVLKDFSQALVPGLDHLVVSRDARGHFYLSPGFRAGDTLLDWGEIRQLLQTGFLKIGDRIVQAPDLLPLERAGFQLGSRKTARGLKGDRVSFIRLIADTDVRIESEDQGILELVSLLRGRAQLDPGIPSGLKSNLRPYQAEGVRWLWHRWLSGIGALLADDMGLGKTHQVMGLLCHVRQQRPGARFLVVCPRGVLEHWENLLENFAPELGVHLYHGSGRVIPEMKDHPPVLLTTYDILVRSAGELGREKWDIAIYDEAQRIKNPRTKAARASKKLKAEFKLALSGTPLENRLLELWSVVDLLLPGYLGSESDFKSNFRNPTQSDLERLRRRLAILTLRRLKEQVLSDLPEKFEDLRYCTMTPDQRAVYEETRGAALPEISALLEDPDSEIPFMHIFALMTRLKQICDYSGLGRDIPMPGSSGKLEVFDEILAEAMDSGQQVVVFSQYVRMLEVLSEHLDRQGRAYLRLTGETRDRGRVIRRFNTGQHERILLASLLAGGVGVDLTGASVVIHYDRWWNPAKENQATDRVHRMGQRSFVQVFKFVTRDSIEERIDQLIRRKISLFEQVVAPTEGVVRGLSRSQIAELLDIRMKEKEDVST